MYFGNMPHELRREAWPILLGLYSWDQDTTEQAKVYEDLRKKYEELLSEWTSVEAIVRERDKEAFMAGKWEGYCCETKGVKILIVERNDLMHSELLRNTRIPIQF